MTDNRTNEPTNEALRKALNVAREHFSAIAASGEIKVWEDTGEKRGIDYQAKVWAERGARLASEALAATRVPAQGEPSDDREAKAEALAEWQDGNSMRQYSEWYTSWEDGYDAGFSRASVPDAATEERIDRWMLLVGKGVEKQMTLRAERDAVLAAVERVRAIHVPLSSLTFQVCEECNDPDARGFIYWPCATIAALDGAPEPEWEERLAACDEHGTHCWSCVRHTERRRPAGEWHRLPVEREGK